MTKIWAWLNNPNYRTLVWAFPLLVFIHEMEEWNIIHWYRQHRIELPPGMNNLDARTWLLLLSLLAFIWTAVSLIPKSNKITAFILMPPLFLMLANCLQHLVFVMIFREYTPGFFFGFIITFPVYSLIIYRSIKDRLIPVWYPVFLTLILIVPMVVDSIRNTTPNTFPKSINGLHNFVKWLSHKIWD